jgi:hypothetical protein
MRCLCVILRCAGLRARVPNVLLWHALQGAAAGPLHPRAGALP